MEEFKREKLSTLSKMNPKEKLAYYYQLRDYLIDHNKILEGIETKQQFHPVLLNLIKLLRVLNGHKLNVMGKEIPVTDRPIIIAFTHMCKFDIERIAEAVKIHFCIYAGDPEYTLGVFPDHTFMDLNGVVFFDSDNKDDRNLSLKMVIDLIKEKKLNFLWAPEGTWNVSPNELVYPCHDGIPIASLLAGAVVLPVAFDQFGKEFFVNIGDFILPETFSENPEMPKLKQQVEAYKRELRDTLATLKYEIFEQKGNFSRTEVSEEQFDEDVRKTLRQWVDQNGDPIYTKALIESRKAKKKVINPAYNTTFGHLFKNNSTYHD